jgi:hypothetical protein
MEIGSVRLGPAQHTVILGNHCDIRHQSPTIMAAE